MLKINSPQPRARASVIAQLTHLHKPVLAMLALLAITLLSGAVYAAVSFAPALLEVLSKNTNHRGATEYSVAGFEQCANNGLPAVDKFEIHSDAPAISDDEFKKTLQAKCELQWIEGFVKQKWPAYGTNAEWKDGDTIYYTRTHVLGKVLKVNDHEASIDIGHNSTSDLKTLGNETLKAYLGGSEIPLTDIKPGDMAFTIVRASEVYRDMAKYLGDKNSSNQAPSNNMQTLGIVALFKMSLPEKYYWEMQSYITEIPKCIGNDSEYCVSTGYIDVYPRGGEGSAPYNKIQQDSVFRQISGTVTELTASSLTLKSRSGNLYIVSVGDAGFATYNTDYAPAYGTLDSKLKLGSNVEVRYYQAANGDPKVITEEQVFAVSLQLESSNPKSENVKQY